MSQISPNSIIASLASNFDVDMVFYAGKIYRDLTLSDYAYGVMPDLTGWTNVTGSVLNNGNLTYERNGNSLTWSATISGVNYTDDYFKSGQAIMCLRRIIANGVQTSPVSGNYGLWFVGQITEVTHSDSYNHRKGWQCTIGGLNTLLERATAPRITAGRVNLMANASVDSSPTLLIPALEANTGEFPGTLVNVDADNTIDDNINTLWISDGIPTAASTNYASSQNNITRLFLNPIPGYDQSKLWWLEWVTEPVEFNFMRVRNQDNLDLIFPSGTPGGRTVLCANKDHYESYFGNSEGVAQVVDVRSVMTACGASPGQYWEGMSATCPWQLSASKGWVQIYHHSDLDAVRGAIAWENTGKTQTPPSETWGGWTGCSIVSGSPTASPGWGWIAASTGCAANYIQSKYCFPGTFYTASNTEWLMYTLEEQSAALSSSTVSGASIILLTSTLGLLDSGSAICEADVFSYTGRTATTLTGIPTSGSLAIGAHANGAKINQMILGVMQTGWPCSKIELIRPYNDQLESITGGRVYFDQTGLVVPKNPDEVDWEDEWDADLKRLEHSTLNPETGIHDYGFSLTDINLNPRWVQYILVVFDSMTNNARARMNEVKIYLAQTQVDNSGLGDIDSIKSGALAEYIFNLAGTTALFVDYTPSSGPFIGEHALAIAPYTDVLDDLARVTGCVINYSYSGWSSWSTDKWWPINIDTTELTERYADLDATYLRGQITYAGQKPNEAGIKIHARTPDGLRQYNAEFPTGLTAADQFIEYDDLVVTSSDVVNYLAQSLYYKAGLFYQIGSQEATFTLKGVGEWLLPEQEIGIFSHKETGEVATIPADTVEAWVGFEDYIMVDWLVESVTWTWGMNNNVKTWDATARCRRFWR